MKNIDIQQLKSIMKKIEDLAKEYKPKEKGVIEEGYIDFDDEWLNSLKEPKGALYDFLKTIDFDTLRSIRTIMSILDTKEYFGNEITEQDIKNNLVTDIEVDDLVDNIFEKRSNLTVYMNKAIELLV